jgi:uncharacterized repeat protein (TIGR01451 family)
MNAASPRTRRFLLMGLALAYAAALLFCSFPLTKSDAAAKMAGPLRPAGSGGQDPAPDADVAAATQDGSAVAGEPADPGRVALFIELTDTPAAVVYADTLEASPLPRDLAVAKAVANARSQLGKILREQDALAAVMAGRGLDTAEIYRVQRVLNGIAVYADAARLEDLRRLPGVKAVHTLVTEYPDLSSSIPFIRAPELWNNAAGLGTNLTGAGIKVGIIDTGIDYQHSNFGGRGLLADYQANNRATNADGFFPTQKVVGGFDFAGDAYTASNAPSPDPDPMDCNGHGTHVAGIAAGFGVNADGTTFTGPFGTTTPFGSLRIGPGAAPRADLYALRVFGCTGGTNITVSAIEWSIDPNGDGDFEDRLDVINMSLGSSFGVPSNPSALASDNAVRAGVIVVAAAGNSANTFFISGAPGVSGRAISVANTLDPGAGGVNQSRINSPPAIVRDLPVNNSNYGPQLFDVTGDVVVGTDVAEPADAGAGLVAGTTTDGCSPLTNAAQVAGKIVLVDRGRCAFEQKSKNAQDAGAIGVIIANNAPGLPNINLADDPTITSSNTVPTVAISQENGNAIKGQLSGGQTVNVTLRRVNPADTISGGSSRGPRGGGTSGVPALKPDIAAPGTNITSAQTGVSCPGCITPAAAPGFIPNNQPLTISGTSMAAPHVAGVMALLREQNPTWTVEELKAQVMNGALRDVFTQPQGAGARLGPGLVGAGRVDAVSAARTPVVAYNADDAGLVSVAFDNEVVQGATRIKTIRVVNKGTTDVTYTLGVDTVTDAPGVSFTLPGGNTITAPAGQTVTFQVRMDAVEDQMDHVRHADTPATQTGANPFQTTFANFPRHYLTEEGAYVTFTVGSDLRLRVPVYSPARPASTMRAADTIPAGSSSIALTGTDVCTGTRGAGPTCTGSFPVDVVSLVSPFELQVVSPRNPAISGETDIRYTGVAYDATTDRIRFGVASHEEWSTPNDVAYSIFIDADENGTYERIVFNTSPGAIARRNFGNANANAQDIFATMVYTPPTTVNFNNTWLVNAARADQFDTVVFNNNVMFLSVPPSALGLSAGNTNFRYKVETCPGFAPLCSSLEGFAPNDRAAGPYTWDYAQPGLDFGSQVLVQDLNGASISVNANVARMNATNSLGALLLHHHNVRGTRAEVVAVEGATGAALSDLALALTADSLSPTAGSTLNLTLTVTNNGPAAATNVRVNANELPFGLAYLSDDSGGTFNPATRTWNVGSLASGATATLRVSVFVGSGESPGAIIARVGFADQIDVNPANDEARVVINAASQADLQLRLEPSTLAAASGSQVNYELVVTNNGEDTALDIVVQGVFTPSSVAFSNASVTQGVFNPGTGVWRIASLGKGVSARLTYRATTPSGVCNQFSSGASVTSGTFDPVTANNSATATTRITNTPCVQLGAATFTVNEGAGFIDIPVVRTGSTAAAATVNYSTSDGTATQKGDYTLALGTLEFAPGEGSKTVRVFITDDAHVEGDETFNFIIGDVSGGSLAASPTSAVITITDNDAAAAPNPIDNVEFFVRQHYRDFLNREPDAAGLAFWVGDLNTRLAACAGLAGAERTKCETGARARVSEAFFLSIEFQQTGFLVYRFYRASFPESDVRPRGLPRYLEFMRDTQRVSQGIVVGEPGWEAELAARQAAFALEFVQRAEFVALYPTTMTPAEFVDALYARAGVTPSAAERQAAIDEFGGAATSADAAARARVLRRVADNAQFTAREFNPAFVLMEYFGYLRRNPNDPPDINYSGYDFWLGKLNSFTDFRQAEMVEAFISSIEYRSRFGQP